jgi:hypothetical protein
MQTHRSCVEVVRFVDSAASCGFNGAREALRLAVYHSGNWLSGGSNLPYTVTCTVVDVGCAQCISCRSHDRLGRWWRRRLGAQQQQQQQRRRRRRWPSSFDFRHDGRAGGGHAGCSGAGDSAIVIPPRTGRAVDHASGSTICSWGLQAQHAAPSQETRGLTAHGSPETSH